VRLHLHRKKLGVVVCACHPGTEDCGPGRFGRKTRSYLQNNQSKKAGAVAQAVEYLLAQEALISNHSTAKKKKKNGF
jgi:hypothetical protein